MSSLSMYETIMDLPLFKGASREMVSQFLEKVHLQFVNYSNGEIIAKAGEEVEYIKFIFTGKALLETHNISGTIRIREIRPSGILVAGRHVFGMDTRYPYTVKAYGKASVLQFSKSQFFSLLQTNNIYLLNMLNYLSLHSQRTVGAIRLLTDGSLIQQLGLWLSTMTDVTSERIEIDCSLENLSRLTNISEHGLKMALATMETEGIALYDEGVLRIPSRSAFFEFLEYRAGLPD